MTSRHGSSLEFWLGCCYGYTFADVIKSQVRVADDLHQGRPAQADADLDRTRRRPGTVITGRDSWKVKRIRNTSRVTLAPCDRRGKVTGETVEAVATVLDDGHLETVYSAIGNRYGLLGKVFNFFSKLRGGSHRNVGLELRAA